MLGRLANADGAEDFVLDHLRDSVPQMDRLFVLNSMAYPSPSNNWPNHPRTDAVLREMAVSEPDEKVAMTCLNTARALEMMRLRHALDQRIAKQDSSRTPETTAQLEQEDERWISLEAGTMLPAFLRRVPPLFSAKSGNSIRVLAFGDFGNCKEDQKNVASWMVEYSRQNPFDIGITTGDNFTPDGMHSVDDPRWKTCWEDLYGSMGIPFYATLGNHDWYYPDSPAAEILYHSSTWHMPSPYYTFTAGPVQFFAIDTENISKAQVTWLTNALSASHAPWKVVYGHFNMYGASPVVPSNAELIAKLMPILKGRADVCFAGHYHSLQHLKPVDGVNLFISGGGGRPLYDVDPNSPVAVWARSEFGFAVIEADAHSFTVRFVGKDLQVLHETTLQK
jgi:hypothetical protein